MEKEFYYRNLPHIQPREGVFFITFRLAGSLPQEIITQLKSEREIFKKMGIQNISNSDLFFDKYDDLLDNPACGPTWLKDDGIAQLVCDAFHFLDEKDYKLICYTIMSNHVHLILYKITRPLYKILQSIKRHTGNMANKKLDRSGPFWQKESYDNLIRDRDDFSNKMIYVLNNPVKAGIVKRWEDYKLTYCNENFLHFVK